MSESELFPYEIADGIRMVAEERGVSLDEFTVEEIIAGYRSYSRAYSKRKDLETMSPRERSELLKEYCEKAKAKVSRP